MGESANRRGIARSIDQRRLSVVDSRKNLSFLDLCMVTTEAVVVNFGLTAAWDEFGLGLWQYGASDRLARPRSR
jgi:hypothetical protein